MSFFKRLFGGSEIQVDYTDRTEDELRELWRQRDSLTDQARGVLEGELQRRGIAARDPITTPELPEGEEDRDLLPETLDLPLDRPEVQEAIRLQKKAAQAYAQGDLQGMLALGERSLEVLQGALGQDHVALASSLNLLSIAKREMGDSDEAAELLDRALKIAEKAMGPDDPALLPYLRNLGNFHRASGKLPESEEVLQRAIALGERSLEPDEPGLAYAMEDLIETYRALGKGAEADALQVKVDGIYDQMVGEP